MKTIYIVQWSNAFIEDHGMPSAFGGIYGLYESKEKAKQGLIEYKDEVLNTILHDEYCEEDPQYAEYVKENTHVYGSAVENYFEIDYAVGEQLCETFIHIIDYEIKE